MEYAGRGSGDPLLVVHGIYQNCVGGLLTVRGLFPDRHVIAPSRFGYLGSSLPSNATVAGQADAFVALLDTLGIGQIDVIGFSSAFAAAAHALMSIGLVVESGPFVPGGMLTYGLPAVTLLWLVATTTVMVERSGPPRRFDSTRD